jgi:hypothetical protein
MNFGKEIFIASNAPPFSQIASSSASFQSNYKQKESKNQSVLSVKSVVRPRSQKTAPLRKGAFDALQALVVYAIVPPNESESFIYIKSYLSAMAGFPRLPKSPCISKTIHFPKIHLPTKPESQTFSNYTNTCPG